MRIKDRFPNETALTEAVSLQVSAITAQVQNEVGALEAEYVEIKRKQKIGYTLLGGVFIALQFSFLLSDNLFVWNQMGEFLQTFGKLILIIVTPFCLFYGFKFTTVGAEVVRRFHEKTNKVLFTQVFTLLGILGSLVNETPQKVGRFIIFGMSVPAAGAKPRSVEAEATLERLRLSELITEPFNTTKIDNLFECNLAGALVQGSELDIRQVSGSSKNRSEKKIFKGYFISCPLTRTLEGKTFVSTEGDTTGFAHRTFWGGDVKETTLEWNQFEALLHVATNNEVEARYVLTTNFMNDLYEWWHTKSTNIRISFIGNQMCLLFPDNNIRFHSTVEKISKEEVEEYLLTIAKPLLHVVHLIEEVRL